MIKQWIQKLMAAAPTPLVPPTPFFTPWDTDRISIYRFLAAFDMTEQGALPEAAQDLPDEALVNERSGSELRWAAGALDGVMGHHGGGSTTGDVVALQDALLAAAERPTADKLTALYTMITDHDTLRVIDPLLKNLRGTANLPVTQLRAVARWLATESPDRSAVKLGIALLGLFVPAADTDILMTMGRHDEFTLYSVVALGATMNADDVEAAWWALAKQVHGWGRIHIVERLADTPREDIRSWLLREGYKNSVMFEYLAYPCAVGGRLSDALRAQPVDDDLLVGASEIIEALITGGPAEDIHDFEDGAEAIDLYLGAAERAATKLLKVLVAVARIREFIVDGEIDWTRLEAIGWTPEVRARLVARCERLIALDDWLGAVDNAWKLSDDGDFATACMAGEIIGLDVWDKRFERQQAALSEQWYFLMQTSDAVRVQRVIDLLTAQHDLQTIATGPADEMGFGPDRKKYAAMDFVLQDLGRFPGLGWVLIQTGLRSPVTRNRNMAIRALTTWGVAHWPEGTADMLQRALKEEPNNTTRQLIADALALPAAHNN